MAPQFNSNVNEDLKDHVKKAIEQVKTESDTEYTALKESFDDSILSSPEEAKSILFSVAEDKSFAGIFRGAEKYQNLYAMALQVVLNEMGFPVGKPDGLYGQNTIAGVKKLQKKFELQETGLADGKLLAKLKPKLAQLKETAAEFTKQNTPLQVLTIPVTSASATLFPQEKQTKDIVEAKDKTIEELISILSKGSLALPEFGEYSKNIAFFQDLASKIKNAKGSPLYNPSKIDGIVTSENSTTAKLLRKGIPVKGGVIKQVNGLIKFVSTSEAEKSQENKTGPTLAESLEDLTSQQKFDKILEKKHKTDAQKAEAKAELKKLTEFGMDKIEEVYFFKSESMDNANDNIEGLSLRAGSFFTGGNWQEQDLGDRNINSYDERKVSSGGDTPLKGVIQGEDVSGKNIRRIRFFTDGTSYVSDSTRTLTGTIKGFDFTNMGFGYIIIPNEGGIFRLYKKDNNKVLTEVTDKYDIDNEKKTIVLKTAQSAD